MLVQGFFHFRIWFDLFTVVTGMRYLKATILVNVYSHSVNNPILFANLLSLCYTERQPKRLEPTSVYTCLHPPQFFASVPRSWMPFLLLCCKKTNHNFASHIILIFFFAFFFCVQSRYSVHFRHIFFCP